MVRVENLDNVRLNLKTLSTDWKKCVIYNNRTLKVSFTQKAYLEENNPVAHLVAQFAATEEVVHQSLVVDLPGTLLLS